MLYSSGHVIWDIGIAVVAALLVLLCRQYRGTLNWLRIAIALVAISFELQRFFTENIAFPNRMPFYLCNVSTWAAVIACLTLNPIAVDFLYFNGLSAAIMALVMPDLGSAWPVTFFLSHSAIIAAASVLVLGGIVPIRPVYPLRAFGMILGYSFLGAIFDWRFGTNYSFMMHKPPGLTLMDYLGPWPWYWLSAAALDNTLILLLWLPVRSRRLRGPLFTPQDRERLLA